MIYWFLQQPCEVGIHRVFNIVVGKPINRRCQSQVCPAVDTINLLEPISSGGIIYIIIKNRISQYSSGWPKNHYIDEAGLKFTDIRILSVGVKSAPGTVFF